MRGVAETTAAVTIVNALPTGFGAAVGIDLRARAEVELHPAGSHGKWDVRVEDSARTPLVIASLTEGLRRFAPGSAGTGELTLRSDIPMARGLKSSSAVSAAVLLAVARATDTTVEPLEVARMSAAVSREVGVSATGALDDALAALTPGVIVTDNVREAVLTSYSIDPGLGVALYVSTATHRPSPEWASAFQAVAEESRSAAALAVRGDWPAAMRENTELVERLIGYDYAGIRGELQRQGAVASGVSGMGPALAAIGPRHRLPSILDVLPGTLGDRRLTSFSTHSAFTDVGGG
jgi:shikimate kinase